MSHTILDQLSDYADWLIQEERSAATAEKYLRSLRRFALWLNERPLCKTNVLAWRAHLQEKGYAPGTINTMLAALHSYFRLADITDCSVKYLRVQRSLFRDSDRALSLDDYHRLVRAAYSIGQHQLALIIETICATGIRVSELRHITTEALANGRADIALKGKIRTILLSRALQRKLRRYTRKNKITHGAIFSTVGGKPCTRYQIWAQMKRLSTVAHVAKTKNLSPQPASSLRRSILSETPRHRPPRRHARSFLRRDHPHLSRSLHRRMCPSLGSARACCLTESIFRWPSSQ